MWAVAMRITARSLIAGNLLAFLFFGAVQPAVAQELPPAPPPPAPRTDQGVRPVSARPGFNGNTPGFGGPARASVPGVPVPLLHPPPHIGIQVHDEPSATSPVTNPGALAFDSEQKEYSAKPGEASAHLTFNLTNISSSEVLINRVTTSCGCTVAKLPEQPWHVAPGTNGPINVTVDLRGKSGTITKSVMVDSTAGYKSLMVKIEIPPPQPLSNSRAMDRTRNIAMAQADRQAVFKSDCAECHVQPAVGKMGKELYLGACAICHEAEHRASMVPDLHIIKHPDTSEYWSRLTSEGKLNSLMPAFGQKQGGFLSDPQIASLTEYMMSGFPKETNLVYRGPKNLPGPVVQALPAVQTNAANRLRAPSAVLGPFQIR